MKLIITIFFCFVCYSIFAQRNYASNSVLNTGTWHKIAISKTGVYKIDVPFLATLGINTSNLNSASIQVYGNTGTMLGEACNSFKYDDLQENAIDVIDGGDGLLNGNDYILFWGQATDYWVKDSLQKRFIHQKNLYSNDAYYFIHNIGTNGKRITSPANPTNATVNVTSFNERFFGEDNTDNLLHSGKEWVGTPLSNLPGYTLTKTFNVDVKNYLANTPITLISNVLARSGATTRIDVVANGTTVQQMILPQVSGNALDLYATQQQQVALYTATQDAQALTYNYVPNTGNAQAWINYWELHTRCALNFNTNAPLFFRDWNSVGNGNIANFSITNANTNVIVWDITNPTNPIKQNTTIVGNVLQFKQSTNYLKEFVAFTNNTLLTPVYKGIVANQNLHNTTPVHLLIITIETLSTEAQRLANYHLQKNNLQVKVVLCSAIFNEFGSGISDVTAIRDFIKMYYDKYSATNVKLQNVLLLGDASYDYLNRINDNTNFVPAWQSSNSNNPLLSYVSDDFFGYLEDTEDINGTGINLLDIGIGRLPVKNSSEAKNVVDKIINYHTPQKLGAWRNQITIVADDEDGNLHLNDAEVIANSVANNSNTFIQDKIYLDAFRQLSGTGGSRYPDVNNAINNKMFNGNLIWNYSGHGGNTRLADEAILDIDMVSNFQNENKLPLFITATCDFAPYDNPKVQSIGEQLVLQAKTGAIALMTTTRVVFAYSNRIINNNYLQLALQRNANGTYKSLGEANKEAKNFTSLNNGDIVNTRKFTLLGDPALTIAFPQNIVRTTTINGKAYAPFVDTIRATNTIEIKGEIVQQNQTLFANFNGQVTVTVYDKKATINTLANDASSVSTSFQNNGNILFKGTATVINGLFSISFIAPKDMQYNIGIGSISYYAHNNIVDANGNDPIMIGSNGTNVLSDVEGPKIKAYLNDTKFINGSLTNEWPILIVLLQDSSGINTSNIGIGHEITATIDGDNRSMFILNDYYIAENNNYKKGSLRFALPKLKEGIHTIIIKAWDVLNNSNEFVLECRVGNDQKLVIDKVLNYPNPFVNNTTFWFEHNKPNEDIYVYIKIFTITGKLVRQLKQTINTIGNRSCEINWDGKDNFGDKIAKGVYIYSLETSLKNGKPLKKIEKLIKF